MGIIKARTGKIFVPITIQNSPLSPNDEMLVLLRAYDKEKSEIFGFDQEITTDENLLSKRYNVR
jgi:hypothetical protein